jgi:hypothetical protein
MRWTCGLLFAVVIAGFPSARAQTMPGGIPPSLHLADWTCASPICVDRDAVPFSQRLVDWTEEGREIYNTVKKLPKGTDKEIYAKYSRYAYAMYQILSDSKKDIGDSYECLKNITYLGGWIKLFYDFRANSSKKHNMSPEGVKEYQDWTEKGYLKYYQECQRIFKIHKLSPTKQ